jgi:hypothetical protein
MSEQSPQERPGAKITKILAVLGRISAPARYLSLAGAGLLTVGAISYLELPSSAGASPASAVTRVSSVSTSPSGQLTPPGPMPGAPTQQPAAAFASGPSPAPTPIQPSNPTLVKTWNSGPGGSALANVTQLSGITLMAQAMKQYPDMLQECKLLGAAVGKAQQAALIPDATMQAKYAVALVSFKLAAASCLTGIRVVPDGVEDTVTSVNSTIENLVAGQLSSGASALFVATGMLRRQ